MFCSRSADGVAHLTLNPPEAANTLHRELSRKLMEAVIDIDIDADPRVRAVLLVAKGKMFSGRRSAGSSM